MEAFELSPQAQQAAAQMDSLVEICLAAHQVILPFWRSKLEVEAKDDNSPVTQADRAANEVIVAALKKLTPSIPVVSEEGTQQALHEQAIFWLVDPVDGTKSFIRGEEEFTVNIALVENRQPVIGVLGVPVRQAVYRAVKGDENGAQKWTAQSGQWQRIRCAETRPPEGNRVISSRSHQSPKLAAWIAEAGIAVKELIPVNSALKFGLIAEGLADLYPRIGPTMEWDTAAGQCIVEAAGGSMIDLQGNPFMYGKQGYLNGGFVVHAQKTLTQK